MPLKAAVGDVVDSQCGVCHDTTKHEVLEVSAPGNARKCRCLVEECGAEHLWRKPIGKEAVKPKRDKEKEAAAKRLLAHVDEFQRLLGETDEKNAASYAISATFEVGQRLEHKKFGPGIVIDVPTPNIIEVHFEESTRRLAMGR